MSAHQAFCDKIYDMTCLLPRGLLPHVIALLDAVSVVVVEGARASGKSSLGSLLLDEGRLTTIVDLSDPTLRRAALHSPTDFVNDLSTPAMLDEIQLAPELLIPIKRRVDTDPRPGSFLLTGSSRVGRTQLGGSDPLAGRSARARLRPMTQSELAGDPVDAITALALGEIPNRPFSALSHQDLIKRIRRGGLPTLAGVTAPVSDTIRSQLVGEYVEGVLYHETGKRHDRAELARMLRHLASLTGTILNVSNVAGQLGVSRETVVSRLSTLEASFLVESLPAHRPTEHRSLTAHPKIHAADTAIAAWAARPGDDPPAALLGALTETLVVNEITAQAGWRPGRVLRHWRNTAKKAEVDLVLIDADGPIPIQIKAGREVRPDDHRGLSVFLEEVTTAQHGLVFYTGDRALTLADRIHAIPISALWEGPGRS